MYVAYLGSDDRNPERCRWQKGTVRQGKWKSQERRVMGLVPLLGNEVNPKMDILKNYIECTSEVSL